MDSNLYFMTINFYGRCSIFSRFQLSERVSDRKRAHRWPNQTWINADGQERLCSWRTRQNKILNHHRNTLWLTQTAVYPMIFVNTLVRTFHICFIMIALWEGFNLLHDIIIRHPNGYVLRCLYVCVVDVDWIKNQKPIRNEYNNLNNNNKNIE